MEQLAETQDSGDIIAEDQNTEAEAPELNAEGEGAEIESQDSEGQPEDDGEEIEYEGEKYKVPKQLKDAFLRQQDYTQKTQTVAEQRRAVEAQAAEVQRQAQAQQALIAEYAEAYSLDSQLKQYQAIDWPALIEADPVQAMKLDRQMRELQMKRDAVVATVTQKQQAQAIEAQQATAKRLQEGRAVLEREINGWSPELAKTLASYGQEIGFSADEMSNVTNPHAVKLLHKAWQFDQLMKKQAAEKSKPAPQEKPVTRITAAKGTAAKDPGKMTDSEFAAWRKRQISQRR